MSWSSNCRIENCQIENNDEGIVLNVCFRTTIVHNYLHQNNDSIFLEDSDGSEIRENTISMNERGILLNSTSECLITQNNVANNTGVGICLDSASHRNEIFNNTLHIIHLMLYVKVPQTIGITKLTLEIAGRITMVRGLMSSTKMIKIIIQSQL